MTPEQQEIKNKLLKEYEQKLDKTLNHGYGKTLWDMEEEVQDIKNEIGRVLLESKLKLKKNAKFTSV